jgi:uridine kinase
LLAGKAQARSQILLGTSPAHIELLAKAIAHSGERPIALIDGRSGSGKSTLARALADGISGAQIVKLDDIYPGWEGLEAGSAHIFEHVLAVGNPRWQSWDWKANKPGEWHAIDPSRPLIVEGVGALSRQNREHATIGIWLDLDATTRKTRAIGRDGVSYIPHWDGWAAQERAFVQREQPHINADIVVDERIR